MPRKSLKRESLEGGDVESSPAASKGKGIAQKGPVKYEVLEKKAKEGVKIYIIL